MECDNVLSPEQWQHLAVTMDPTSSRNPMRIYVNNQNLKGTIDKPADGVMYTLKDIDADAVVGTGFIGKMDELMVWRNARTTFTSDMDGTLTLQCFQVEDMMLSSSMVIGSLTGKIISDIIQKAGKQ